MRSPRVIVVPIYYYILHYVVVVIVVAVYVSRRLASRQSYLVCVVIKWHIYIHARKVKRSKRVRGP